MNPNVQPIQGALSQVQNTEPMASPSPVVQTLKKRMQAYEDTAPDQSTISQAMGILNDKSTIGQVGKAIQTPNYAGYCLKWVDDQQGSTNRLPTAYADYQSKAQAGNMNDSDNPPVGARVYFAPDQSNKNMGHVGISQGNGKFTSATDNGIKTFSLQDWEKYTGQKFLGWSK